LLRRRLIRTEMSGILMWQMQFVAKRACSPFLMGTIFGGAINRNSILSNGFYYYFIPTICFGPYGPSSGGICTR
jgi:hypothetical protein